MKFRIILKALLIILGIQEIGISQLSDLKAIIPSNSGERKEYLIISPSIRIELADFIYWDSIQVLDKTEIINQKNLFLENGEFYKVFDSLEQKEYTIKHFSSFGDSYEYKLNLNSDTLLNYPKVKLEYKSKELKPSDSEIILKSDSIQLLVIELGCYHYSESLYQINKTDKERINKGDTIYLQGNTFQRNLSQFLKDAKNPKYCESDYCTRMYVIKSKNILYNFYGCCDQNKTLEKITNGNTDTYNR